MRDPRCVTCGGILPSVRQTGRPRHYDTDACREVHSLLSRLAALVPEVLQRADSEATYTLAETVVAMLPPHVVSDVLPARPVAMLLDELEVAVLDTPTDETTEVRRRLWGAANRVRWDRTKKTIDGGDHDV